MGSELSGTPTFTGGKGAVLSSHCGDYTSSLSMVLTSKSRNEPKQPQTSWRSLAGLLAASSQCVKEIDGGRKKKANLAPPPPAVLFFVATPEFFYYFIATQATCRTQGGIWSANPTGRFKLGLCR